MVRSSSVVAAKDRCGNFGCPLPNLHKGLCQPQIGKRGARKADGRRCGRAPTAYIDRQVPVLKPEPKKIVLIGPDHQISDACLPDFGSAQSVDRGCVQLHFDSKAAIQRLFEEEKHAALAWAARFEDIPSVAVATKSAAAQPSELAVQPPLSLCDSPLTAEPDGASASKMLLWAPSGPHEPVAPASPPKAHAHSITSFPTPPKVLGLRSASQGRLRSAAKGKVRAPRATLDSRVWAIF